MSQYYLSFDCATKTFAFTLSLINHELFDGSLLNDVKQFLIMSEKMRPEHYLIFNQKCLELIKRVREAIIVEDGETTDLIPGVKDEDITQIMRVKALAKYVKNRIPVKENMIVAVEYQMGDKANIIASALYALYADYELIEIFPTLKNGLFFSEKSRYGMFSSKYSTNHIVNKHHAEALFLDACKGITCKIADRKNHVADSFLQVFAYLKKTIDRPV